MRNTNLQNRKEGAARKIEKHYLCRGGRKTAPHAE